MKHDSKNERRTERKIVNYTKLQIVHFIFLVFLFFWYSNIHKNILDAPRKQYSLFIICIYVYYYGILFNYVVFILIYKRMLNLSLSAEKERESNCSCFMRMTTQFDWNVWTPVLWPTANVILWTFSVRRITSMWCTIDHPFTMTIQPFLYFILWALEL